MAHNYFCQVEKVFTPTHLAETHQQAEIIQEVYQLEIDTNFKNLPVSMVFPSLKRFLEVNMWNTEAE